MTGSGSWKLKGPFGLQQIDSGLVPKDTLWFFVITMCLLTSGSWQFGSPKQIFKFPKLFSDNFSDSKKIFAFFWTMGKKKRCLFSFLAKGVLVIRAQQFA